MFTLILCPLLYSSSLPLVTYWYQYSRISGSSFTDSHCSPNEAANAHLKTAISYIFVSICVMFSVSVISAESRLISATTTTVTQLSLTMFLIIMLSLAVKNKFSSINSIEFVNAIVFTSIALCALLLSANALSAFFALELLGALTLYGFFVFGSYKSISLEQSSSYMAAGSVYQFILNFLGSFLFYTSMALICASHGTYSYFAPQSALASNYAQVYQSIMILAILIKLGTGPWIFYKFSIYKSFTVTLSVLYTFIYFTGVLVFLYNIFGVFGVSFNTSLLWALIFLLSIAILVFSSNVYQTGPIVLFLSFSSLLNLTFMVLQLSAL